MLKLHLASRLGNGVEKIRHRCITTGETFENVVATVKGSISRKTLKNLARYVLKKPVASVTDSDILGAVEARCRKLKNEEARVQASLASICAAALSSTIQGLCYKESGSKVSKDAGTRTAKTTFKPPVAVSSAGGSTAVSSATDSSRSSRAARPPRAPPSEGCLICKGPHWLNDCPVVTDAQRDETRRKYREAKEQRSNTVQSKSASNIDSLCFMQPLLQVITLPTAVEAIMADGRVQMCEHEILLDLELSTLAGQVSLRSVPCLVMEGDEFLLGRDVLKGLGIDVEQQLAQLAGSSLLDAETDDRFSCC
ncbi:hypothetical protein PC119_g18405 [Phytophthora cactorum]|nr:hypothetical protein PC119_g18405 [Phytophthora cactorum]